MAACVYDRPTSQTQGGFSESGYGAHKSGTVGRYAPASVADNAPRGVQRLQLRRTYYSGGPGFPGHSGEPNDSRRPKDQQLRR